MTRILDFYAMKGTDGAGRTLQDVWGFDPRQLESRHDFIQWLFPLREPSRFNPDAPVLTAQDEARFRADPVLRANLLRSLDLMLRFYGLARTGDDRIAPPDPQALSRAHWLAPGDHNHLRLSRIVRCLAALGEETWARALQAELLRIAAQHPGAVSARTVEVWRGLLDDL